jgi:Mg-chelatase subunit ChlD
MKQLYKIRTRKFISLIVSVLIAFTFVPIVPIYAEAGTTTFTYEGYTVAYNVVNEWEGGQSVEVTLTNTATTPLNNWAIGYDAGAEIQGIYNASIHSVTGSSYIIKNPGYNSDIAPNSSVAFGYSLTGNGLPIPTAFGLCPTVQTAMSEGYIASLNVTNDWGTGFQGEIILQNTTANEISDWQLSFNTNFTISDIWNGEISSQTENSYTVTGNAIPANGSVTIGFGGEKAAEIVPAVENFAFSTSSLSDSVIPGVLISSDLPAVDPNADETTDNTGEIDEENPEPNDDFNFLPSGGSYPSVLFASGSGITSNASNFSVNGNVTTNGTFVATGTNPNINGIKTDNANQNMIYIFNRIDQTYFSGEYVNEFNDDYTYADTNININTPAEILGTLNLDGNISLNTGVKALGSIALNGEVKNSANAMIFSKYGNVTLEGTDVSIDGLIYAPFGTVTITAQNFSLNGIIIAESINLNCLNVNINYNQITASFVGNTSEPLNIPESEWQYMPDDNGNGLPDLFEDIKFWHLLIDSDNDRIPDPIENCIGTDLNSIDSDSDGLDDFCEIFYIGTSPILTDSDSNGITDANEDMDSDGISNINEISADTSAWIPDTDSDNILDGEEVYNYSSNPLNADTDGDSLFDADEIILSLNPTSSDTDGDGILDPYEKINQIGVFCSDENSAIGQIKIAIDANGNVNKTTSVLNTKDIDVMSSNIPGLVGYPIDIKTTSDFSSATISFSINTQYVNIALDNLIILWYDEENQQYIELDTEYDYANSTVSTTTNHFSRYMVVNKRVWYEAWNKEFNYSGTTEIPIYYNTVLAIDCSSSMSSWDKITTVAASNSYDAKYPKTCNRIKSSNYFIDFMNTNDKASVLLFGDRVVDYTELTNEKETLKNMLQKVSNSYGTAFTPAINKSVEILSNNEITFPKNVIIINRIILLTDGSASISNEALEAAKEKGIIIHTVGLGSSSGDTTLKNISSKTGGEFFKALTADELIKIYSQVGIESSFDKTDNDNDGLYDIIETSGILLQNANVIYTDPTKKDSDGDGLSDGEEVGNYTIRVIKRADGVDSSILVFVLNSNPNLPDSDKDGYNDFEETKTYKTNPLISDVFTASLDENYVKVNIADRTLLGGNDYSYGGSQTWFYNENDTASGDLFTYQLENGGCGIIASCDTLLYLQNYNGDISTTVPMQTGVFNWSDYNTFVKDYARDYLTPFDIFILTSPIIEFQLPRLPVYSEYNLYPTLYDVTVDQLNVTVPLSGIFLSDIVTDGTYTWGTTLPVLTSAFNSYASEHGNSYAMTDMYPNSCSKETMEDMIYTTMLLNRPSILSLGHFCDVDYENLSLNKPDNFSKAHFMTITSIKIDKILGETEITLSTWSQKVTLSFDEFYDNAGIGGGLSAIGKKIG